MNARDDRPPELNEFLSSGELRGFSHSSSSGVTTLAISVQEIEVFNNLPCDWFDLITAHNGDVREVVKHLRHGELELIFGFLTQAADREQEFE